jgi:hypothetical protein
MTHTKIGFDRLDKKGPDSKMSEKVLPFFKLESDSNAFCWYSKRTSEKQNRRLWLKKGEKEENVNKFYVPFFRFMFFATAIMLSVST